MRLKQLYIKGFKSFAEETVINFEHDVIGVVGPNGSGKSNIVDAIRWVLGEQKGKELRLERMSDVLFNGTKKKKKSKVAKVSITFENDKNLLPTEFSTITISRLLFRTGESEYRLNDVPCRLKDIHNILVDTGIGSNSYAIIALGMVDDILANKDNARRKMFEQAAGISKFKKRKKETLNKLKNTNADLERVEDLLSEIESNLKALEKQAKRTERYYKLKEEYKNRSIQYALLSTRDNISRGVELNAAIEQAKDALAKLQAETAGLEAKIQKDRNAQLEFEMNLSGQQKALNEIVEELRRHEALKNSKIHERNFLERENASLIQLEEKDQQLLKALQEQLDEARKLLHDTRDEQRAFDRNLEELNRRRAALNQNNSAAKEGLESLVRRKNEEAQRRYELEKEIAIIETEMNNLQQKLSQRQAESAAHTDKIENLLIQIEKSAQLIEDKSKERDHLKAVIEAQTLEQEQLAKERQSIEEKLRQIVRTLDAKSNEFGLIESMVEKMEGSPESIKFLAKQKRWSDTAALFSDILLVDDTYRVCMENYLEPYLQHYVVDTEDEALRGIRLLTETQQGRANFFVLDRVSVIDRKQSPSVGRWASSVVSVEAKYQNLLDNLLANVIIVDKPEDVEKVEGQNYTVLRSDGSYIRKGPKISGGSVGLFEGKRIGRKKQLEQLQKEIKKLRKSEEKLDSELLKVSSKLERIKLKQLMPALDKAQVELHRLEQNKVALDIELTNLQKDVADNKQFNQDSIDELTVLKNKKVKLSKALDEQIQTIQTLDKDILQADVSYQDMVRSMNEIQAKFNEESIKQIRFQNKRSEWEREVEFCTNRIKEITQEQTNRKNKLKANDQKIESLNVELKHLEDSLIKAYEAKKEEQRKLSDKEKNYYKGRELLHKSEEVLRNLHRSINQQQAKLSDLNQTYNEIQLELSGVRERLMVEFEVELDRLRIQDFDITLDFESLRSEVERLRKRIHQFGDINPMAIEAYREIEERYLTIKTQRDDIVDAKESLLQTIDEIQTSATEKFMEAYERVRIYFQDVFRSLFTEDDTCDLILLDPENPLDSEIEIIAKPKGKRPKSLSQLSGGEKTLTATALLFALYLLKPAPFCVFDEVDAPLDDANVEKFNRIINKFSEFSQFVIVTHNKQTMAAVDVIYGVYMEETGVSGLSPVDFSTFQYDGILRTIEG